MTPSISTTDLVGRMLIMTKHHHSLSQKNSENEIKEKINSFKKVFFKIFIFINFIFLLNLIYLVFLFKVFYVEIFIIFILFLKIFFNIFVT